jgi:hypothetical protein
MIVEKKAFATVSKSAAEETRPVGLTLSNSTWHHQWPSLRAVVEMSRQAERQQSKAVAGYVSGITIINNQLLILSSCSVPAAAPGISIHFATIKQDSIPY